MRVINRDQSIHANEVINFMWLVFKTCHVMYTFKRRNGLYEPGQRVVIAFFEFVSQTNMIYLIYMYPS